jgi:hypothetical protein
LAIEINIRLWREIQRERLTVERFENDSLLVVVGVVVGDSGPRCLWPALGGIGRWRGKMEMVGRNFG